MKEFKHYIIAIAGFWILAGLQSQASRLALLGVAPDFLIAWLCVLVFFCTRRQAIWLGFFTGLIHGSIAAVDLAYYAISRLLTGYIGAWAKDQSVESSPLVVFITVFVGTCFAYFIRLLLPPGHNIPAYLLDTILTATYNGVLAMPMYALLKKAIAPTTY